MTKLIPRRIARLLFWGIYCALVLAIIWSFFTCSSCIALVDQMTERPAGCEQSIIYDRLPAPKVSGAVLLIAVNEAAHAKPEVVMYILGSIDSILEVLQDDQVTYVELAMQAAQQISWINTYFGNRVLVYSELIAAFDRPVPLYPCDRMLIRNHLKKQRDMLTMGADP